MFLFKLNSTQLCIYKQNGKLELRERNRCAEQKSRAS